MLLAFFRDLFFRERGWLASIQAVSPKNKGIRGIFDIKVLRNSSVNKKIQFENCKHLKQAAVDELTKAAVFRTRIHFIRIRIQDFNDQKL